MMYVLKWFVTSIAIIFAAMLVPGVSVASFWTALWLAIFMAVVNVVLKPILILLTLPINLLTLGLFTFVVNALLILLASSVIKGFEINGFWTALLFGIVLSAISYILNVLFDLA